ncbi:MAG: hypothetical protein JSU72_06670 [Deltaproteobacteria bacterium]|nr:MAG: hypothetical protein JSU72_06670 [Deltaproteobacteria bacterium]
MDEQQDERVELEETEVEKDTVDLNRVFGEVDFDLNSMFPDGEMKKFLRQVNKNRRSNERFLEGFKRDTMWEEDEG